MAIDGTIDTEVQCAGVHDNAAEFLSRAGAKLFYSTDMGHPDIPHGIDAQEIHMGLHVGFHSGKDYPTCTHPGIGFGDQRSRRIPSPLAMADRAACLPISDRSWKVHRPTSS